MVSAELKKTTKRFCAFLSISLSERSLSARRGCALIDTVETPPEKRSEIDDCIDINRFNLRRFLEEFQRSVALFELLERGGGPPSTGVFGGVFIYYRIIAAKDGAMNIYHFGCALNAIRKFLPKSTLNIDAIKMREAERLFKHHFPHWKNVRDAIVHAGERFSDPTRMKSNNQKRHHEGHGSSVGCGGIFGVALYERTFSIGNHGDIFAIEMNNVSVSKLDEVITAADSAFPSR